MKSILEFLFSSTITFPGSWTEEHDLGRELEEVMKLRSQVGAILEQVHPNLWAAYQEKSRNLQRQDCRAEFERGFLMAASLALEVFRRARDMEL